MNGTDQPMSLCLDAQSIFSPSIIPKVLKEFNVWYKEWSRDPVINNAGTGSREWAWLDVFLHAEVAVQVPLFILGAWWLWKSKCIMYLADGRRQTRLSYVIL
jgi:hypothetical protein